VEATGYHEALAAGVAAAEEAARAAGRDPVPAFSAHHANPTGSWAARANARVDANGIVF
jgi:hypothetical protein